MADEWLSVAEAKSRLGVTDQTLRNWFSRAGSLSSWKRGKKWNVTAILAWRSRQSGPATPSPSNQPETPDQQARKLEAEIRFKEAQADLEELEVAKEMGLVLPRLACELTLSTMFGDLRRYLDEMENLTHQIPPDAETGHLTPETVKAWLHARNDAYQNGLAERLQTALVALGPVPDLQGLAEGLRESQEAKAGLYAPLGREGD